MKNNHYLKFFLVLLSGTAIAQLITIAISPLLTRMYDAESFGDYSFIIAIVSIITPLATGKLELALVIPKDPKENFSLLKLNYIFLTATSTVFGIFTIIINLIYPFLSLTNIIILVVLIFSLGNFNILKYWSIHKGQYKVTTNTTIIQSFLVNFSQLTLGWMHYSLGLVFGKLIGQFVSNNFFVRKYKKDISKGTPKFTEIKGLIYKYRDFILYNAPQSILASFSNNLVVLLTPFFFSNTLLGLYALAVRVLFLPIGVIGNTFKDVFFKKAADIMESGQNIKIFYLKSLGIIGLLFFPICGFLYIFSPSLFSVVFGNEWHQAGVYASYISIWIFAIMLSRPALAVVQLLKLQKQVFNVELIGLITKLILFIFISYSLHSFSLVIIFISVISLIQYLYIIYFVYYKLNKNKGEIF